MLKYCGKELVRYWFVYVDVFKIGPVLTGKKYTSDPSLLGEFYGQLGDAYNALENHKKSDESYEAALERNPKLQLGQRKWSSSSRHLWDPLPELIRSAGGRDRE